jgi:hypothetical protein
MSTQTKKCPGRCPAGVLLGSPVAARCAATVRREPCALLQRPRHPVPVPGILRRQGSVPEHAVASVDAPSLEGSRCRSVPASGRRHGSR